MVREDCLLVVACSTYTLRPQIVVETRGVRAHDTCKLACRGHNMTCHDRRVILSKCREEQAASLSEQRCNVQLCRSGLQVTAILS